MTPKEAVAVLMAAFRQDRIEDPTIRLYQQKLCDIAPALLEATIHRVIERAKFFPSIAEIRETAASLAGLLPPSPEEALAVVRQADQERPMYRSDGSVAYMDRHWDWPTDLPDEDLRGIEHALAIMGDPMDGNGTLRFGWETDFKRVYAPIAEGRKQRTLGNLSRAALPCPRHTALSPPAPPVLAPLTEAECAEGKRQVQDVLAGLTGRFHAKAKP